MGWEGRGPGEAVQELAHRVADVFDGWWSVDFIMDRDMNWYVTDMALDALYDREAAERGEGYSGISEHPEDCPNDVEALYA